MTRPRTIETADYLSWGVGWVGQCDGAGKQVEAVPISHFYNISTAFEDAHVHDEESVI